MIEIIDKVFDTCLLLFVVMTAIIVITDDDDLRYLDRQAKGIPSNVYVLSLAVMVLCKIASIWLS